MVRGGVDKYDMFKQEFFENLNWWTV